MSVAKAIVEVGPGFWNIRGSFKFLLGMVDIGTHMSLVRLNTGRFVVIDTIPLEDQVKKEFDELTNNGELIDAVIATHPFHTLAFPDFQKAYPNPAYYGTPRHIRTQPQLKWAGSLNDCETRKLFEPQLFMRVPDGAEFVNPTPEMYNHFTSVFVFHPESRTIHVDDTIGYAHEPGFLLRVIGAKEGVMTFHPTMKGPGLYPTPEAPFQFRDWVQRIINEWDFDNICTAHMGNKIGGAKAQLQQLLNDTEPVFKDLSEKNKKGGHHRSENQGPGSNVSGSECG